MARVKKKGIGKENTTMMAVMVVLMIVLFAVFCIFNLQSTFGLLSSQVQENLLQLTASNAMLVDDRLGRNEDLVTALASGVIVSPNLSMEEKIERLSQQTDAVGVLRIGFADPEGNAITTDKKKFYIGDRPYFQEALKGKVAISDALEDRAGFQEQVVISSAPVVRSKETIGVLFIVNPTSEIEKIVNVPFPNNCGEAYVMNSRGNVLFASEGSVSTKENVALDSTQSLLQEAEKWNSKNVCSQLKTALESHQSGVISITLKNMPVFVSYSPIRINDWVFVSILSKDVVSYSSNTVLVRSSIFTGVAFLVFLGILMYIITSRRQNAKQIRHIAFEDHLTGIGNYNFFLSKCESMLQNQNGVKYAMVYFDIENFKVINDTFGYDFGDQMLAGIAGAMREVLCHGEFYARLSNDYFAFIMPYYTDHTEVLGRIQELSDCIGELEVGKESRLSICMPTGVYLIRDTDTDANKVINRATMAHNTAKNSQNLEHCVFYNEEIRKQLNEENEIATEIRTALRNGEFEIYYQPKFVLKTEQLAGYEALIRWNHPVKGIISPGQFVPIAERSGSIAEIGRFVFDRVCMDIRDWMENKLDIVPVSFNLSRVELFQSGLMDYINETMKKYKIPSYYLEAEITETAAISGALPIQNILNHFKVIGIKISMDDFGTGYSSLSCLKNMPIDILKLDRSFLNDIESDVTSRNIARAVIALAKSLNLVIISEGVETRYQAEFLTEAGCDLVQGFYFGRPQQKEVAQRYMKEPYQQVNKEIYYKEKAGI